MQPLKGFKVLSLATNLPGPVAVQRFLKMGAEVTKIEPPSGDLLNQYAPDWYREIHDGVKVLVVDLKSEDGKKILLGQLEKTDLLITASRLSALKRLGLDWADLHKKFPKLCQVAIVGYPSPNEEEPSHDLTCQAVAGLLEAPTMPSVLIADLAGAEWAISEGLALLLEREKSGKGSFQMVSLAVAGSSFSLRNFVVAQGGMLRGDSPVYNLYQTKQGWVAIAALEEIFQQRLREGLNLKTLEIETLSKVFLTKSAQEWHDWAKEKDIPLVKVKEASHAT